MKASANTFTLKSNEPSGQLEIQHYANGMGFTGENKSPQLFWENAPQETHLPRNTIYRYLKVDVYQIRLFISLLSKVK